ncbi:magnesium chelatase domain-containing protein [Duganella guangzhouensis]|uniref:magnesium chelatase domain-containing protein n=1 Tax=Duganella guangzhouensis TaxID=2666084 RepID=UPI0035307D58
MSILAVLKSRALAGMEAQEVSVEVHLANGLPAFTIVGLADTEVKEAKDRVRAAIQNGGFEFPAQRITVNLAPADLPKESGYGFDGSMDIVGYKVLMYGRERHQSNLSHEQSRRCAI